MVVFFPNIFHTMSPSIMVDLVDRTSPFWSWRYHICFTVCLCTCLPIPCPCPVSIYLTLNGVILMSFTTTYTYFIVVLFPTISIVLFFYLDIFDVVVASAFFRVYFCIENFPVTISVEFLFLFSIVIACAKYCWWHQMSKDLLAKCIGIVCSAKQAIYAPQDRYSPPLQHRLNLCCSVWHIQTVFIVNQNQIFYGTILVLCAWGCSCFHC